MGKVRWLGMKAVEEWRQKGVQRYEMWKKLNQLTEEENIGEFYKLYAEYLEFDGIISVERESLHKMARLVEKFFKK